MNSYELACAIIDLAPTDYEMNNIKLNSMMYLEYVEELKQGNKLFDDQLTAAKRCVFIKDVKEHFWPFVVDPIPVSPLAEFTDEIKAEAEVIWNKYNHLTQEELVSMTCGEGSAWANARKDIENEYLPVPFGDEEIKNSTDFE